MPPDSGAAEQGWGRQVTSLEHTLGWSEQALTSEAGELETWLQRCLAGEENAYSHVYKMYGAAIFRLSFGLLQNREDAEEVLQDTFEYAFRRLNLYDARKSHFKSWLYQIAVSRCRNKRRRHWLPTLSLGQWLGGGQDVPDENAPAPDEAASLSDEQQRVWQLLGQLSPKLQEVMVLRYYEGLGYAEIGAILGIPAKTAESRARLAHKALRPLLVEP